jgi:hypothetical protein
MEQWRQPTRQLSPGIFVFFWHPAALIGLVLAPGSNDGRTPALQDKRAKCALQVSDRSCEARPSIEYPISQASVVCGLLSGVRAPWQGRLEPCWNFRL